MSTKSDLPQSLKVQLSDKDVDVIVGLLEDQITAWHDSEPLDVPELETYERIKRIRRQLVIAENMRAMGYET